MVDFAKALIHDTARKERYLRWYPCLSVDNYQDVRSRHSYRWMNKRLKELDDYHERHQRNV